MAGNITTFKREGIVIGIGPRKNGLSSAGKPYDFYEIAINIPRKNWEGYYPVVTRIPTDQMERYCIAHKSIVECLMCIDEYQYKVLAVIGAK